MVPELAPVTPPDTDRVTPGRTPEIAPYEGDAVESPEAKSVLREYFESAVVTVIMALFGMTFVIQAVKVPTGSMQNNILIGDHLLVNKFIFGARESSKSSLFPFRNVRRGDVIVFKFPQDPQTNYVKRVIGLPGDTIEIRGVRVLINGEEWPEHRIFANRPLFDSNDSALQAEREEPVPGASYKVYWEPRSGEEESFVGGFHTGRYGVGQPFQIPEGHYFAMGDNRDDSEDSRFWGTVPRENIIGRALIVYWSYDERAAERGGNLLLNLFRYTRWQRTGALIP
ncbi:MAG: signal peptidase I [Acidobacteria bacterium]|nr:signal peptidase I [Acidobacteriota bacterium]